MDPNHCGIVQTVIRKFCLFLKCKVEISSQENNEGEEEEVDTNKKFARKRNEKKWKGITQQVFIVATLVQCSALK